MQMAHFIVSFRIDNNSTYQERYESLRDRVKEIATGYVWDETTSLYILQTNGTAESVANDLYFKTKLLAPGDTLLVVDHINRQWAGHGIKYEALLGAALGIVQTK